MLLKFCRVKHIVDITYLVVKRTKYNLIYNELQLCVTRTRKRNERGTEQLGLQQLTLDENYGEKKWFEKIG